MLYIMLENNLLRYNIGGGGVGRVDRRRGLTHPSISHPKEFESFVNMWQ